MSTLRMACAGALCLLTGCGTGPGQALYTPMAGARQMQTADAAYWNCVGQNLNREMSQPSGWTLPVGVAGGIADAYATAPARHAFMRNCMEAEGYATKPHFELTTGTWEP